MPEPVDQPKIKQHEIIDRVEAIRTLRLAEARMRGRDHLAMLGEPVEEGRIRTEILKSMQQEDRLSGAATKDFQRGAIDRKAFVHS